MRSRKNKKETNFMKYCELQCLYSKNEAGKEQEKGHRRNQNG